VLGGDQHMVSASIGIAVGTAGASAAELLRDADAAMYQAKTAGRAGFELFDREMHMRVLDRVRTESAFCVQRSPTRRSTCTISPGVAAQREIVGAEALARWRHVDWGSMSPAEFVAVAEDSGLIRQLGAQVMHRAARESAGWQHVPGFARMAVNVSTRQLLQPDELAALIREVTTAEGIPPGFLTVEITESMLIERLDAARSAWTRSTIWGALVTRRLRYGLQLAELPRQPELRRRQDRSTADREDRHLAEAAALAAAIIQMGHALAQQVIAEGVETVEQATRLQDSTATSLRATTSPSNGAEAFAVLLENEAGQAGQFCLPASARGAAEATACSRPRPRCGPREPKTPLSPAIEGASQLGKATAEESVGPIA